MGIAARVTCEYFFCQGNDGVGGFSCLAIALIVHVHVTDDELTDKNSVGIVYYSFTFHKERQLNMTAYQYHRHDFSSQPRPYDLFPRTALSHLSLTYPHLLITPRRKLDPQLPHRIPAMPQQDLCPRAPHNPLDHCMAPKPSLVVPHQPALGHCIPIILHYMIHVACKQPGSRALEMELQDAQPRGVARRMVNGKTWCQVVDVGAMQRYPVVVKRQVVR